MAKNKKPKLQQEKVKESPNNTISQLINEFTKKEGIINAIGDGLTILDRTFKILYENKAHRDIFGDHVGEHCYKAYQKGQGVCGGCPVALTFKDGIAHTVEREIQNENETRYFEITASPLKDPEGKIIAVIEVVRDITERKQIEDKLQEEEERYRLLFNNVSDAIFVHGVTQDISDIEKFKIIEVNDNACKYLGYTREELLQMNIPELDAPETLGNIQALLNKLFTQGTATWEGIHIHKDGHRIPVEISNQLFELYGKPMILSAVRDITERKLAEEALRESEKRYGKLIDSLTDYLYTVELKNGQPVSTKHGPGCVAVTGYTSEEYEADLYLWYRMVYEEDKEAVMKQADKIISGKVVKPIEHRIIHKNGEIKWVRNTVVPRLNEEGVLIAYDGLIENISDRKKTEEMLYASEKKFRTLFNSANDAIAIHDMEGHFLEVNETICKRLGYSHEELINMSPMDIDTSENAAHVQKRIEDLLQRKYLIFETAHVCRDGTVIPVEVSSRIIDYNGAPAVLSIARDITERKQAEEEKLMLEEQLLHAQKMKAIGQLAGGIAHDFNNILTAIIGFATLLKMETNEGDILRSYITPILNSAERATNLTQALLAFSRRQIINPKPCNLNNIINGLHALLSRVIGEDIELFIVLSERDLIIMADTGQIEQVLMNLATNARDAMPDGGKLIISIKLAHLDSEFVKAHGFGRPGAYALVSVEDTGKGIDEKTKERIFEPFFTTKEVGKGTGLGLAMVYGIIKQHDGYIDLYSERGIGTRFNIYLPLIKTEVEETKLKGMLFLKGGEETVLVAEDDALVRTLVKEVLERFGYMVLEAKDGEDALRVFHENEDKIQLLILDVIMPKKNGKEVYDAIREIKPDMRAIFTSGYDANIIHKKGVLDEGLSFVSKPILTNELLRKVREVLDKRNTR